MSSVSDEPLSEALERILASIRAKARVVKTIDELRSNTEGNVREGYKVVIENELYAMIRLIDDFKMEVCNSLSELHSNAPFRGSIFPVNTSS